MTWQREYALPQGLELDFSRDDLTRVRNAIQSCIFACNADPQGQTPGTRPYNEARELMSIGSRFIALIEAGQEETVYGIRPLKGRAASKPGSVTGGLPGLGGQPYSGLRSISGGKAESLQQEPGEASKGDGQPVPVKTVSEEGEA